MNRSRVPTVRRPVALSKAYPLVEGCLAWLECRLIPEPHIEQAYDLFLGEVVAAWADPGVFDGAHWKVEEGGKRSIHYVAGGHFFEIGEAFDVNDDDRDSTR